MIIFNNISISQDDKYLTIDAEIENSTYYKNMYIDSVVIDNQDTYIQNGPSNNPIYVYKAEAQDNYIYTSDDLVNKVTDEDGSNIYDEGDTQSYSREVHLKLDKNNIGEIANNMFFVYIIAGGTPSPDTPCGYDVNTALKVVINTYPIYNNMMQYLKELGNRCNTPYGIIDNILQIKMLDAAVQTGNNLKAIQIWNTYFKNKQDNNININCGCNGRA